MIEVIDETMWGLSSQTMVYPPIVFVLTLITTGLLAWRIWRFQLVPKVWPHEPKLLPYWIPVLGKYA